MNRTRLLENLHIPLWLIKDLCWAMVYKPLGVAMILPTLSLAVFLCWRSREHKMEFLPNLSVTCWILANSVWMLDEFYEWEIRQVSVIGFLAGLFIMLIWLVRFYPEFKKESADTRTK